MELDSIINSNGSNRRKRRVGSGEGNGHGKTCGRGQKGSKARSGYSVRPGFEGGQMPLYLKIPRRGFNNYRHRTNYEILNVRDLEKFDASETINLKLLMEKGYVQKSARRLKLLSAGEVSGAYTVEVEKASAAAIEKIEKAGGKVITIQSAKEENQDS
jgi:large subunit ribosomal protein L15